MISHIKKKNCNSSQAFPHRSPKQSLGGANQAEPALRGAKFRSLQSLLPLQSHRIADP